MEKQENLLNCKVGMLPTQIKSKHIPLGMVIKNLHSGLLEYNKNEILSTSADAEYLQPQHIYLVSDEKVKAGDYALLDWEGKGIADDMRVGKVNSVTENSIDLNNQYGNVSICNKQGEGRCKNAKWYKVEATNDNSFTVFAGYGSGDTHDEAAVYEHIPQIPQSFTEAYVKANGKIEEVQIETYKIHDEVGVYIEDRIKTNPDNTVTIHY